MKKFEQKELPLAWAENTGNRIEFSDQALGEGIVYQSNVVSNQLNGAFYTVFKNLEYLQKTAAPYNKTTRYYKNSIVSILRKTGISFSQEFYVAIKDNADGFIGISPLLSAVEQDENGLFCYEGGYPNNEYWLEVTPKPSFKPVAITNFEKVHVSDTYTYCCKICELPKAIPVTSETVLNLDYKADLLFQVTTNAALVNIKVRLLTKMFLKENKLEPALDFFNCPSPDVYIDEVVVYKIGTTRNFEDYAPGVVARNSMVAIKDSDTELKGYVNGSILPYGIGFAVGYTKNNQNKKSWGLFLYAKDVSKINVSGVSDFTLDFTSKISDRTVTPEYAIAVRPFGGANAWGSLGELVEFDNNLQENQTNEYPYIKGFFSITKQYDTIQEDTKDIETEITKWSLLKPLLKIINAKTQAKNNKTIWAHRNHMGRYTRNWGGAIWRGSVDKYDQEKVDLTTYPYLKDKSFLYGPEEYETVKQEDGTNKQVLKPTSAVKFPDELRAIWGNVDQSYAQYSLLNGKAFPNQQRYGGNSIGIYLKANLPAFTAMAQGSIDASFGPNNTLNNGAIGNTGKRITSAIFPETGAIIWSSNLTAMGCGFNWVIRGSSVATPGGTWNSHYYGRGILDPWYATENHIYEPSVMQYPDSNYMPIPTGYQFQDVRPLAISIVRFIKAF